VTIRTTFGCVDDGPPVAGLEGTTGDTSAGAAWTQVAWRRTTLNQMGIAGKNQRERAEAERMAGRTLAHALEMSVRCNSPDNERFFPAERS
jgi:hypothetical protein